jgi:hypothetical protein
MLIGFKETTLGSWISRLALHKFAWDVRCGGLSPSALQASPARAALFVWVGKLEIQVGGEGGSSGNSSSDEDTLDWLVLSVESGWTRGGSCCGFFQNLVIYYLVLLLVRLDRFERYLGRFQHVTFLADRVYF